MKINDTRKPNNKEIIFDDVKSGQVISFSDTGERTGFWVKNDESNAVDLETGYCDNSIDGSELVIIINATLTISN